MSDVLPIEEDPRFRLSTATDGQTEFSVPFPFQSNGDIRAVRISADGATRRELQEAEDYTLTGAGEIAGGTLVLIEPAVAGEQVLRYGRTVLDRTSGITRGGKYSSQATDDDLDRLILIAQEMQRDLARAPLAPFGQGASDLYSRYDVVFFDPGRAAAGELVFSHVFNADVTFAAAFAGSHAVAKTAAAAPAAWTFKKNGVAIGSMTFAAAATTPVFALAADTVFVAGDVLDIFAPSPRDATLAAVSGTLAGRRNQEL